MKSKNIDTIKKHLEADVPLFIKGESGWGKSAIIKALADELNLPLVVANVTSWTAEDFGGIPRPDKNNTSYDYLAPKWVVDNRNNKFILFLDEINQANVNVLHALYRVVLDREVAGIKLNFYVIAAGNFDFENQYLTELPEPLMKRFSVYEWKKEHTFFCNYLNKMYKTNLKEIYTNPRQTEMALKLYNQKDIESARKLGGEQLINYLSANYVSIGANLIKNIELDEIKLRNGILR